MPDEDTSWAPPNAPTAQPRNVFHAQLLRFDGLCVATDAGSISEEEFIRCSVDDRQLDGREQAKSDLVFTTRNIGESLAYPVIVSKGVSATLTEILLAAETKKPKLKD